MGVLQEDQFESGDPNRTLKTVYIHLIHSQPGVEPPSQNLPYIEIQATVN
jgi:hypothetical protein